MKSEQKTSVELEFHRGLFLGLVLAFDPKKTFTHVARMPHLSCTTMPTNEKTDPVQVSLLGAEAIVQVTNKLPDLVQQSCGAQNRRPGFMESLYLCFFAVYRVPAQAASHFQEEAVPRIFRIVQLIPQVLRDRFVRHFWEVR